MNNKHLITSCHLGWLLSVGIFIGALSGCSSSNSGDGGGGGAPTASVSPADGATGVERDAMISATFSEDMFATTLDSSAVTLSDGNSVAGTVAFDAQTNIVTFTPTNDLALLRNYTATLASTITDLSGNALAATSWSFTTHDREWGTAELIETDNSESSSRPQIALDVSGNAVTVWQQSDGTRHNIWANHYTAGTGWGTAVLIETDDVGTTLWPQVASDHNGNAVAVWLQSDGTRHNIWANHYTLGIGWGTAVLIETDTGFAGAADVAVDANGNAVAVWRQSDGTRHNIWGNRYTAGTGWGTAVLIETDDVGTTRWPQVVSDSNGNAVAVWEQHDGTRYNIWANHYTAGTGWGTAVLIESDDTGSSQRPQVAFDSNGNAVAVWQRHNGTRNNISANHYTAGTGWGTAVLIESDDAGNAEWPQVAFDSNGNAVSVWEQHDGTRQNIWANHYTTGIGWGTAVLIETDNVGNAFQPDVAVDASGNAVAVWNQLDDTSASAMANRYVAGSGWGTAAAIENDSGHADAPRVAVDANGNVVAVWAQSDGTTDSIMSNRFE